MSGYLANELVATMSGAASSSLSELTSCDCVEKSSIIFIIKDILCLVRTGYIITGATGAIFTVCWLNGRAHI